MPGLLAPADELIAEAHLVIDARRIESVFQPLVHIETDEVIGYEALTRGPAGSPLENPLQLLAAARAAGRLAELDWLCAASAYAAATAADLHPSMTIFLNIEPATLLEPCPDDLVQMIRGAQERLRVLVELKEESLVADPGGTFDALAQVRAVDWGVAIADAAATHNSLALLPLAHPDVLKLNLRKFRAGLLPLAEAGDGARLYAERTGATILVEGIESPSDVLLARAAGATFGQGWYFGHPGPLPRKRTVPRRAFPLRPAPEPAVATSPFEIVGERCPLVLSDKAYLVALSRYLENQSDSNGPPALLLISSARRRPPPAARARVERLVAQSAFTVVLGPGYRNENGPGWRVQGVSVDDPIADEWNVIVLGAHYAAALVAREVPSEEGHGPRFTFAVTHEREVVSRAARSFLRRLSADVPVSGASEPL